MTHRLTTNCAKNYCNRTLIVKVIVENVVTCFFGTRCIGLGVITDSQLCMDAHVAALPWRLLPVAATTSNYSVSVD